MNDLIKKLSLFYFIAVFFLIIVAIAVFSTDKTQAHLSINAFHTDWQDFFFKYYTHIADGLTVVILTVIISLFYIKQDRLSILFLGVINIILVGVIVQSLKQFVFYEAMRPSLFITSDTLYRVPGVDLNIANSFPSGHTAAAFALSSFLAFLLQNNKFAQVLCALGAILAAYSRVYLSQHFLEDILFGGVIGLVCFLLSFLILKGRLKRTLLLNVKK